VRSASDRRTTITVGLFLALAFAAESCARVHIEPGSGHGGTGGSSGAGGSGGAGGDGGDGDGGRGGVGGTVVGGNGGGGSGGTAGSIGGRGGVGGSAGSGGTGGVGGSAGSGGAGGRGGAGGSAGVGGSAGTGGTAGIGGRGGTGGTAGVGGSAGIGGSAGSGGTGGVGGSAGAGGTGGQPTPMGVTPTVAGQIVITELMHDTSGIADDNGEWFEVYNPSTTVTYDLLGCEARDVTPGVIINVNLVLPPQTFKTLAVSAIPGFTPDFVYTPVGVLPIVKFDNSGADQAEIRCGGVTIDIFGYPTSLAGVGAHSFSVDPDHYSAVDNDVMANWCVARDSMVGDSYETSGSNFGTPGRPNTQCP
jgi:hypothetical protein